jgi:pantoate--beta-alanine ligase
VTPTTTGTRTIAARTTAARVTTTAAAMAAELDAVRRHGGTVGFVPTMGALHAGHASLVRRAAAECDVVAVSIFVNPLQFGVAQDLDSYPRRLVGDTAVAADAGATWVFAPSRAEMYDGVTTVVSKLFAVAGRSCAYFGEKDFQQLQVVRQLARDLSLPVEVIGCPTVRDPDGLALSSRNARLSPAERAAAPVLHRALQAGATVTRSGCRVPGAIRAAIVAEIALEPLASLDYAEVVTPDTLGPPGRSGPLRLLVAAHLGSTRLIDNLAA